jgi:hypothetical protein
MTLSPQRNSRKIFALLFLGATAAFLLLWHLDQQYLWQDEAQTALFADRMLRFGRPLAYDGVNLITIDHFAVEDNASIDQRTRSPKAAIDYYVRRGDFRPDTTWIWHPWGQFVVEAASLKLLGKTTLAARLPFALAGIITVLLLYIFVLREFESELIALLAALFLSFNTYWILHSRQSRYYSLSSLFLVVTLLAYSRWQRGARWGAAAFVVSTWCWFQVDYGTLWPVLLILFCDAFIASWPHPWRPALVGGILAAALLPFAYYFGLWRRHSAPTRPWDDRLLRNLLNVNEYVVPLALLLAAALLLSSRSATLQVNEQRWVRIACCIIVAFCIWVPVAAPSSFVRYVIIVAPVGCTLTAWVLVRGSGARTWLVWAGAAVFLLTPWLTWLIPPAPGYKRSFVLRPELAVLWNEIFVQRPDPNRQVIEWLKTNSKPSDEILINYEDLPLMFYLPNPVRGGIAAFRVEDDEKRPPDFVVLRRSVNFTHWPVYKRELDRYEWTEISVDAPDVTWGNNPDPTAYVPSSANPPKIYVGRRQADVDTQSPKPDASAQAR